MKLESVPCRSFQVVTCLLQIVSGRFLFTVSRFMSFFSCSRLSQVVSGCSLLVVGHFRLFQVVSCSFQVVLGRFPSFQVVPRFSKYEQNTHLCRIFSFFAVKRGKEILGNGRYLNKTKQDPKKFNFLYYCKVYYVYLRHELFPFKFLGFDFDYCCFHVTSVRSILAVEEYRFRFS